VRELLQSYFRYWAVKLTKSEADRIKGLRVLVLGIYLADREHFALHLNERYGESKFLQVTQRWVSLNDTSRNEQLRLMTNSHNEALIPKFKLLNEMLEKEDLNQFDLILISDDDVKLPKGFLDKYVAAQTSLNIALAQPSRAIHSFYDHKLSLRRPWLKARQTRFVEIGPVFSFTLEAAKYLVPFDEKSAMGWGYDLIWPVIMERNNLQMGIVDLVSVDHSYRPQGQAYSRDSNRDTMNAYLKAHEHLEFSQVVKPLKNIYF
jgi:hypothetical protein